MNWKINWKVTFAGAFVLNVIIKGKSHTLLRTVILSCGFCLDFSTSEDLWSVVNAFVYLCNETRLHSLGPKRKG